MPDDTAETLECDIGTRPSSEAWLNGRDDAVERREILIVEATTSDQFPDAFDWVELRAVGRKEMQPEMIVDRLSSRRVKGGMMVACIIADDDDIAPALATDALEFAEEVPAGLGIKHACWARHDEFSVGEAHRAEKTDALYLRRSV